MRIKKVCVIGAGTMGSGIAQVSGQAGYETVMADVKQELVDRGMNSIRTSLDRFVKKGAIKQNDVDGILARIHTSASIEDAAKDANYVIEAVFEKVEVKVSVLQQVDRVCPEETILASTTSAIPVALLASATKRPDKVIGTHFMNPVPVMKGVEVVRSLVTSEETLDITLDLMKSFGKEGVVVRDSPGFVASRIAPLFLNEAAKLFEENVASVEDIDKIMKLSFNWPMGPFELADLFGVDVLVDLLEGIYKETGWERFKPTPLLKRMVEIGYLGRKVGKGFYTLGKK